jgi:hypothetical protein
MTIFNESIALKQLQEWIALCVENNIDATALWQHTKPALGAGRLGKPLVFRSNEDFDQMVREAQVARKAFYTEAFQQEASQPVSGFRI